jgi:predicted heme/steroid binding protein/uncharacterized membrane protein
MAQEFRNFTPEDLARFSGENGTPIYIAFEGRVFDVTTSRFWRGGMHMKRHPAGKDLTAEMSAAPHDLSVLNRYPQVGVLVPRAAEGESSTESAAAAAGAAFDLRSIAKQFLEKHPFFRRHPHPMTVHFPIVLFIFSPLFTILYLATGFGGFEITALNCLGAGLLSCLAAIPTGFLTWWINYNARPIQQVTIKIVLSLCLFVDGSAVFIWRLLDPGIAGRIGPLGIIFLILDFLLLPMVVVVAWVGATLTFPLARTRRARHLRS